MDRPRSSAEDKLLLYAELAARPRHTMAAARSRTFSLKWDMILDKNTKCAGGLGLVLISAYLANGQQARQSAAEKYFTDTILIGQNGQEQRLYTDLINDTVFVINPMDA